MSRDTPHAEFSIALISSSDDFRITVSDSFTIINVIIGSKKKESMDRERLVLDLTKSLLRRQSIFPRRIRRGSTAGQRDNDFNLNK